MGAVYYIESRDTNGGKVWTYYVGIRRNKIGELYYIADDWNGLFGSKGRRLSDGPKPSKKKGSGGGAKGPGEKWTGEMRRLTDEVGDVIDAGNHFLRKGLFRGDHNHAFINNVIDYGKIA